MTPIKDKYPSHKSRIFLGPLLALVNGLGRGTTLEQVEAFYINLSRPIRDLCEEDAKARDPEDPRVEKFGHLRNAQEAEHLQGIARVLGPYAKRVETGPVARRLLDANQLWRQELQRAMEMTYHARTQPVGGEPLVLTLQELPGSDDDLVPEFLEGSVMTGAGKEKPRNTDAQQEAFNTQVREHTKATVEMAEKVRLAAAGTFTDFALLGACILSTQTLLAEWSSEREVFSKTLATAEADFVRLNVIALLREQLEALDAGIATASEALVELHRQKHRHDLLTLRGRAS